MSKVAELQGRREQESGDTAGDEDGDDDGGTDGEEEEEEEEEEEDDDDDERGGRPGGSGTVCKRAKAFRDTELSHTDADIIGRHCLHPSHVLVFFSCRGGFRVLSLLCARSEKSTTDSRTR